MEQLDPARGVLEVMQGTGSQEVRPRTVYLHKTVSSKEMEKARGELNRTAMSGAGGYRVNLSAGAPLGAPNPAVP